MFIVRACGLTYSSLGISSFSFHLHCLIRSSSYPCGRSIFSASTPTSVRISNRFLDGPLMQLLADGTLLIRVFVSWAASLDQYSFMIHALTRVGLVPFISPYLAASFINVEKNSSSSHPVLPYDLRCVARYGLGLAHDLFLATLS